MEQENSKISDALFLHHACHKSAHMQGCSPDGVYCDGHIHQLTEEGSSSKLPQMSHLLSLHRMNTSL